MIVSVPAMGLEPGTPRQVVREKNTVGVTTLDQVEDPLCPGVIITPAFVADPIDGNEHTVFKHG